MLALRFGATVSELKQRMSYAEFVRWAAFYERHPFDDFHLQTLPAALQICATNGAKFDEVLDILLSRPEPTPEPKPDEKPFDIDMSIFAAFGSLPPPTYGATKK